MSCVTCSLGQLSKLSGESDASSEGIASLTAIALMQSCVVSALIEDVLLPALPATSRMFPKALAKRMATKQIFTLSFVTDLKSLSLMIADVVESGSHRGWEADENHNRGGYNTVSYDDNIASLVHVLREMAGLGQAVLKAVCAAQALDIVET